MPSTDPMSAHHCCFVCSSLRVRGEAVLPWGVVAEHQLPALHLLAPHRRGLLRDVSEGLRGTAGGLRLAVLLCHGTSALTVGTSCGSSGCKCSQANVRALGAKGHQDLGDKG